MKCPSCGAEAGTGKFCAFCGSPISVEMLRQNEMLNKAGCPSCGSTNVSFNRENQGEVQGKNSKQIVHYTVGLCRDCGYTWRTGDDWMSQKQKGRKTWLWVLGWIFLFPLPLTLILVKRKEMNAVLKYALIALSWIIYLAFVFANRSGSTGSGYDRHDHDDTGTRSTTYSTTAKPDGDSVPAAVSDKSTDETVSTTATPTETKAPITTAATTAATTTRQTVATTQAEIAVSTEYKNALKKAETYSRVMYMSKQGIYDQLTSAYGEGFPADAAQYALDHLNADYKANALHKAQTYSDTMHMSKQGLYDQLVSEYGEQFTAEEAQYAVDHLNADYKANALAKAKVYQSSMSMSKNAIYDQLTSAYGEQFTAEEAQYAIDHLD